MILFRCFPWDREAADNARGGPLWFARMLQGDGRHDNPLVYGCLYCSADALSAVVEQLAALVGRPLRTASLRRFGLPLALAAFELPDEAELMDLDDPATLVAEGLRPSQVATNERERTQADAAALYRRHEAAVGLRWWSTFEAQWPNVTLFDRAAPSLAVGETRELAVGDDVLQDAALFLGLRAEA